MPAPRGVELDEPVAGGGAGASLGEVLEVLVVEDGDFGGHRSRGLLAPKGVGRRRSRKGHGDARGGNAAWQGSAYQLRGKIWVDTGLQTWNHTHGQTSPLNKAAAAEVTEEEQEEPEEE